MEKKKRTASPQLLKNNKFVRIILLCLTVFFCVLLCGLGVIGLLSPDRAFSQKENRVLEKKPVLTFQTLFDGSFMKSTESYLTDQYPFRDFSMSLKGRFDIMLGKTQQNGVHKGRQSFLFDTQADYSSEDIAEKAGAVSAFGARHKDLKLYFVLVPNSSYVYSKQLPMFLKPADQKVQIEGFYAALQGITQIDAVAPLMNEAQETQLFYKTDHHWTTRGAFAVFKSIITIMGGKVPEDYFEFFAVSDSFEGTLKAKNGATKWKDTVEICLPKNSKGSYFLEVEGTKKGSLFEKSKLSENNHYEVFLGGNYGKVTVTTKAKNSEKLLIIKDSYANCMLPMLTPYFSKIVMVDPRYMTEGIEKVMTEEKFTRVLFLYNANTFFADTALVPVLESVN